MSYRKWILVTIFLFAAGVVSGLAAPTSMPGFVSEEIEALQELGSVLAPFSALTVIVIFIKNALALLMSFALSPILCLVPALTLVANGWLIAFVSTVVIKEESLGFLLAGLLPHGIFEIPALIIGLAAAFSFGTIVISALFKKDKRKLLLPGLKQNFRYVAIALALLVPAAIIETYVTPLLLQWV